MSSDLVRKLFAENPKFHQSGQTAVTWNSQEQVLQFIADTMKPGMNSLETGCGYSTILFAATGARHTSVTPSQAETEKVVAFCKDNGIDTANLHFGIGFSHAVLPGLAQDGPLHLAYIDGAHAFPHPCIDWFYTEDRLEVGGYMLVDDVRIPTCRMLYDYLRQEKNWEMVRLIGDTAVFRKLAAADRTKDWLPQNFNRSYPDFSFLPLPTRLYSSSKAFAERAARALGITGPLKKLLGKA